MNYREEAGWRLACFRGMFASLLVLCVGVAVAQEFEAAQKLFLTGKYDDLLACVRSC